MHNRIRTTTAAAALVSGMVFAGPAQADATTNPTIPPCPTSGCSPTSTPMPPPDPCFDAQQQVAWLGRNLRLEQRDAKHARHTVNVLERRIDAKDRLIRQLRAELRHR